MSTYWGYICLDCNRESSDQWYNHGDDKLSECVQLWPQIKALLDSTWIEVDIVGGKYDVFSFLREHEGHNLKLHNEYGETKDLLI